MLVLRFTARRYASAVCAVVVCPSVIHKSVFYQSVYKPRITQTMSYDGHRDSNYSDANDLGEIPMGLTHGVPKEVG